MKDITIPLPNFLEEQIAEVEVIINGKKRQYNFRIESFPWRADEEDLKKGSQETTVKITIPSNIAKNNLDNHSLSPKATSLKAVLKKVSKLHHQF